ncbi:50S RIBOSOMAL PROTEIN L35 [Salix purpurea]|uniref:50S ribosomal protein L35 n=1 Tax=Salix purpurea TaxID=77065 RepID=A0A9Q0ZEK8_SALPP|nr:50S RIBOSOMAL PROTEIN L35 [Salix purpurea]
MASLTMLSFNMRLCPLHCFPTRVSYGSAQLAPLRVNNSLRLSSCRNISGSSSLSPLKIFSVTSLTQRFQSLTVFAAKGYKRKTHKASAKRFRVTGTGKIVRRRAGKQHLLAKKNTKRKLRLSKMHPVNRSDYDNVIGALPYLKQTKDSRFPCFPNPVNSVKGENYTVLAQDRVAPDTVNGILNVAEAVHRYSSFRILSFCQVD